MYSFTVLWKDTESCLIDSCFLLPVRWGGGPADTLQARADTSSAEFPSVSRGISLPESSAGLVSLWMLGGYECSDWLPRSLSVTQHAACNHDDHINAAFRSDGENEHQSERDAAETKHSVSEGLTGGLKVGPDPRRTRGKPDLDLTGIH